MKAKTEAKLTYSSDRIRLDYLREASKNATIKPPDEELLTDTWDGYDDLTYVQKVGSGLRYYEGWVDSCWEQLLLKPGYEEMSYAEAIEKFVAERLVRIAEIAGYEIASYEFTEWDDDADILIVDLKIKTPDKI